MLSTTNTDNSPKTSSQDFKKMLLARHGQDDTICVSGYKQLPDGKVIVSERFCKGIDAAADLIERSSERPDILAIWTNLQRLKPDSTKRKKGETIDAYTNIIVDIDRRDKYFHTDGSVCRHSSKERKECGGIKLNATDDEVAVLLKVSKEVAAFLIGAMGAPVHAFSGNGWHLQWKLRPIDPEYGQRIYTRLLVLLKKTFESPDLNMEIDASLSDETQVVTAWGTWNRKCPDLPDRPQRQSEIKYLPSRQREVTEFELEEFLLTHKDDSSELPDEPALLKSSDDKQQADPDWLDNYGVPDLIEFFGDYIQYESDSYDKDGDEHHPITPCPCHKDEDLHEHSHRKDCEIIVFADGGIGISCFSRDFGLKSVIAKLNKMKGENYPHLVFADDSPTDEEIAEAFGVKEADAITPVGEVCYRENCQCGNVHVKPQKPVELFEPDEFLMGEENGEGLIVTTLDKIKSRKLEFLWEGRIPKGKGVIMHGPPGCGKTNVALSLIAILTRGLPFPDGAPNPLGPRRVMMAVTEDDYEDTIKPRLQAAGADVSKVVVLKKAQTAEGKSKINLDRDAKLLLRALSEAPDVVAVFFDPITSFYGDMDGNDNKRVRPVMEKLAEVCRRTKVNVFAIIHENRRGDASAIDKILGAGALGQVFRVALRFSNDPKGATNKDKIMATTKSNLTKTQGGLRYHLGETKVLLDDGNEADVVIVEWGEVHELMADDVISQGKDKATEGGKLESAKKIALDMLMEKDGCRLIREVKSAIEKKIPGISEETMKRIKGTLGLKTFGKNPGPWWWALPDYTGDDPSGDKPAEKPACTICQSNGHTTELCFKKAKAAKAGEPSLLGEAI